MITADIPLAADVVAKGAQALNPRGELYTDANVGERLAMRNLLDDMRGGGRTMRGPSPITRRRPAGLRQSTRSLADHGQTARSLIATRCHPPALGR